MIEHIPDLIDAGIDSYKIEGRMKTALYVATVARTYRKAIDDYLESPDKYKENMPWYLEQIKSCTYRQFTTGFSMENLLKRHRYTIIILMRKAIHTSVLWVSRTKRPSTAWNRGISSQLAKKLRL